MSRPFSDRAKVSRGDAEPGFFAQFSRRGVGEFLAVLNAAAGGKPGTTGLDQQQPVRAIKQQYPG